MFISNSDFFTHIVYFTYSKSEVGYWELGCGSFAPENPQEPKFLLASILLYPGPGPGSWSMMKLQLSDPLQQEGGKGEDGTKTCQFHLR